MKKLLLVLIFIVFLFPCAYAFSPLTVCSGVPADSDCTPCSGLDANAVFYIDFDYDDACGTGDSTEQRTACIVSSTLVGTLTTATIVSGPAGMTGNALYGDGTDNQEAYITFSNSGGQFDSSEGSISFKIYPTDSDDDNQFFYAVASSGNGYMRGWVEADGDVIKLNYSGSDSTLSQIIGSNAVNLNAVNTVTVTWNVATDTIRIKLNATATESKSDVAIVAFNAEPSEFTIGNSAASYELAGYIDEFEIRQTDNLLD